MPDAQEHEHHQHAHGMTTGSGPAAAQSRRFVATVHPQMRMPAIMRATATWWPTSESVLGLHWFLRFPCWSCRQWCVILRGRGWHRCSSAEEWVALALSSLIYFWLAAGPS